MLTFRKANENDAELLYRWANDRVARENAYSPAKIPFENHLEWFRKRVHSKDFSFYVFINDIDETVGLVRFETKQARNEAIISIFVDEMYRGKGLSSLMLQLATSDFLLKNAEITIFAFIFKTNQASYRSFLKAGFILKSEENIKGIPSYILFNK
jgi:UDP-2,4-diacetamido-2,4,6-trideoxy-beta-L-altropyranose hydrolase